MRKLHVDVMGNRKILFAVSAILVIGSIAAVLVQGLNFGIEFRGGTVANLPAKQGVTEERVRDAMQEADVADARNATIQVTDEGQFIVRSAETNSERSQSQFAEVGRSLGYEQNAISVQTIGPGWGRNVTNRAVLALTLSLLAIAAYLTLRFEFKMSMTALATLFHDVIITLGLFSLLGREVTPNTVAALLTILGFSLYDTIVVFHRIRENSQHLAKQTFLQMTNDSINQVLVRSINTSLVSLIPAAMLLFFGGETLQDFAFALLVGLAIGVYSSIAFASPLYASWKETEPKYRALAKKFGGAS